jgi:hypothetical protein
MSLGFLHHFDKPGSLFEPKMPAKISESHLSFAAAGFDVNLMMFS